jgi:sec-independent protein translocase protein TatA
MFGLGIGELVLILVIVLIIFGAGKLPEIGEGLGRGIRSFRKAVKMPDEIDVTPGREEDNPPADVTKEEKAQDKGPTQA